MELGRLDTVRARRGKRLPVVLAPEEVAAVAASLVLADTAAPGSATPGSEDSTRGYIPKTALLRPSVSTLFSGNVAPGGVFGTRGGGGGGGSGGSFRPLHDPPRQGIHLRLDVRPAPLLRRHRVGLPDLLLTSQPVAIRFITRSLPLTPDQPLPHSCFQPAPQRRRLRRRLVRRPLVEDVTPQSAGGKPPARAPIAAD